MYFSIAVAAIAPERVDEVRPLFERLLPSLRAAPGWQGVTVVIDRSTGQGALFGLWESEYAAVDFESSGVFQSVLSLFPPGLQVQPPRRRMGEVVFHARRGESMTAPGE